MQDYREFLTELRQAVSHIGARIQKHEAQASLSRDQYKKLTAPCFMTSEYVDCRALVGYGKGPLIAEITHGVGMTGERVIGITVFHARAEYAELDHEQSGLQCSIGEAVARLRELNAGAPYQNYCVEGEDRAAGAIGTFERFSVTVKAQSESEAKDIVRAARIESRDHTLITKCYVLEG